MNKDMGCTGEERLALGVLLTIIQMVVFFGFIYVCAFRSGMLATDPFNIGVPLSFISGLGVIICGALLTCIYVVATNSGERQ